MSDYSLQALSQRILFACIFGSALLEVTPCLYHTMKMLRSRADQVEFQIPPSIRAAAFFIGFLRRRVVPIELHAKIGCPLFKRFGRGIIHIVALVT